MISIHRSGLIFGSMSKRIVSHPRACAAVETDFVPEKSSSNRGIYMLPVYLHGNGHPILAYLDQTFMESEDEACYWKVSTRRADVLNVKNHGRIVGRSS